MCTGLSLWYTVIFEISQVTWYKASVALKRMFFYNAVQQWNTVSDNDLVRSSDAKKFKRNYFNSVICKFTPDSFKIDRIF